MSSAAKMDFFEIGDRTSLVCAEPAIAEPVCATLRELGFKFHRSENPDDAVERIRYTAYDMILIQENLGGSSLRTNSVVNFVTPQPMSQRRNSMVVLIGAPFKTMDAMQAFSRSVQLVVNPADLPNLTAILKKSRAEYEATYKVYNAVVTAVTEKG